MGWLTDARSSVKAALTEEGDDWNSWDYNPERVVAPAIALTYGSPLLADGLTFGDHRVRFVATLIPKVGTNESMTDALDAFIESAVERALAADLEVEEVTQPYMLQANNQRFLAVDLRITADYNP